MKQTADVAQGMTDDGQTDHNSSPSTSCSGELISTDSICFSKNYNKNIDTFFTEKQNTLSRALALGLYVGH